MQNSYVSGYGCGGYITASSAFPSNFTPLQSWQGPGSQRVYSGMPPGAQQVYSGIPQQLQQQTVLYRSLASMDSSSPPSTQSYGTQSQITQTTASYYQGENLGDVRSYDQQLLQQTVPFLAMVSADSSKPLSAPANDAQFETHQTAAYSAPASQYQNVECVPFYDPAQKPLYSQPSTFAAPQPSAPPATMFANTPAPPTHNPGYEQPPQTVAQYRSPPPFQPQFQTVAPHSCCAMVNAPPPQVTPNQTQQICCSNCGTLNAIPLGYHEFCCFQCQHENCLGEHYKKKKHHHHHKFGRKSSAALGVVAGALLLGAVLGH